MNLVRQNFSYVYIRLYTFFSVGSSMIYIRLYTYITKRAVMKTIYCKISASQTPSAQS